MPEIPFFSSIVSPAVILTAVWTAASLVLWSIRNGISPMPTSRAARKLMMNLLAANLPPQQEVLIMEAGSGWGSLVCTAARRFPHCRIEGYETSPVPFLVSRLRLILLRLPNVELKRQDFSLADTARVDVLLCYLYPGGMTAVKDLFETHFREGSVVISNTFSLPGIEPEICVRARDFSRSPVYLYRKRRISLSG